MSSTTTHLLYLHGFRSSPQSMKAQKVGERVRAEHPAVIWWCPQLPPSPRAAMDMVMHGVQDWPRDTMAVVGSSLGGFYARWVALQTGCRRVALLNPAVYPARDLVNHLGEQTAWHDPQASFVVEPSFMGELQLQQDDIARLDRLHPATPERQFAIVAKGDEVLDWREMQAFCAGGTTHLLEGGDHAISDFDAHMGDLFRFLGL